MRYSLLHPTLVLALLWIVAPCVPVASDEPQPITMVFGAGYPPFYNYSEPDGRDNIREGMFVDFLDAFSSEHPEFPIRRVVLPRIRLDSWIEEGLADAFSLNNPAFMPPECLGQVTFSLPLWRTGDHVAVRSYDDFKYTHPRELKYRTLGLLLGNGYGPLDSMLASGELHAERPWSMVGLYLMLDEHHVDTIVVNKHAHAATMAQARIPQDSVKLLDPPLMEFDLGVAVRNDRKDFLGALNGFIRKARTDGLLDSLEKKWTKAP